MKNNYQNKEKKRSCVLHSQFISWHWKIKKKYSESNFSQLRICFRVGRCLRMKKRKKKRMKLDMGNLKLLDVVLEGKLVDKENKLARFGIANENYSFGKATRLSQHWRWVNAQNF